MTVTNLANERERRRPEPEPSINTLLAGSLQVLHDLGEDCNSVLFLDAGDVARRIEPVFTTIVETLREHMHQEQQASR